MIVNLSIQSLGRSFGRRASVAPPDPPVALPNRWGDFGDSQTAGRASDTPTALNPGLIFATIWEDSGYSAPIQLTRNGVGGRGLPSTFSYYQGVTFASTPWLHFQESGFTNITGQVTPEDFANTFESMVTTIRASHPDSIISMETAYSYQREAEANYDWTNHNIALISKVNTLNAAGAGIYLLDVDYWIKQALNEFAYAELCIPAGETNANHYTGLGNFLIALLRYKAFRYNLLTLDHSSILLAEADKMRVINLLLGVVDSEAPTSPTNLQESAVTSSGFTLTWDASTDNVGVYLYRIFIDGILAGTSSGTSAGITGLDPETLYSVTVQAGDVSGNWSPSSVAIDVTTGVASDVEAPTVPAGLAASSVTHNSMTLSWSASTDNVGVTLYELSRDTVSQGTTSELSMSQSGLAAETSYAFQVRARDAAGNWSDWSSIVNQTTDVAPTTPGIIWEDDFERADAVGLAAVGNGWAHQGGTQPTDGDIVSGNFIRRQTSGSETYTLTGSTAGGALPADFALEVDMPDVTVGSWLGFYGRWNGTTGVRMLMPSTTVTIGDAQSYNTNNVTVTTVNPVPANWGSNGVNTARVEFEGTTIRVYLNGVHTSTATVSTNSALSGGSIGICGQAQDRAFNSVRVLSL